MNYLESLTEEIILRIFELCLLDDQHSLAFVSHKCRRLVTDKTLQLKDYLLDRALVEIEKQNYDTALKILDEILRIFPDASDVWKEIALCYKQKEDLENALEALFVAKKYSDLPYKFFVQSQLLLYIKKNGGHLAHSEINKAIDKDPEDLRYYHFRAFIESGLYREDDRENGLKENDSEQMEKLRAESLNRELADYEFIVTKPYKRMASIYNNMGAVYFEKGNNTKALEYFDMSTALCSYYLQAYYNRAIVCKEINNVERAVQEYDAILAINPNLSRINTLRAQCNYAMGQYDKALADFLISLDGDKVETDTVMGMYKSMIRTKKLEQTLPILEKVCDRMRKTLEVVEQRTNKELLPLKEKEKECSVEDLLRIEAKEKMLQKMKKDALDVLQISLRFSADLHLLLGQFNKAGKCVEELAARNIPYKEYFVESLLELGGTDKEDTIPPSIKEYTFWVVSQIGSTAQFRNALAKIRINYENASNYVQLTTHSTQLYFISCYAYFYLCMHTPRRNNYCRIMKDLRNWIFYGGAPPGGTVKLLAAPHQNAHSRICKSPYALVHILEIFKKTKNTLDIRERTLATLLDTIGEKRHKNDREFERFANRLIRKTVTTNFAGPHFRAEYF